MLFSYLTIALISICYFFYYYITRTFTYWKIRNVAGPKPVPLFGCLQESALRKKNIGEVFKNIYDEFPDEKVVGIYRMTSPGLLLRDLDVIKQILIKDFDHFSDRGVSFSDKGLGNNLFHADTEIWRGLRARFTPMFTSGKLKNMVYLMVQCADRFADHFQSLCSTQHEQEIHKLIQKYTMATISSCAFGSEFDTISNKSDFFAKIDDFIFSPTVFDDIHMMYPGILKKLKLEPFPKEIYNFFEQLVKSSIEQRNGMATGRNDFMDLILELRQQREIQVTSKFDETKSINLEVTDGLIAAQAFVFYAAGYETSATTMSFMLYELAKNPDIQDKVIAEVDEVLKKYDGKVSYETLMDLKYMQKCLDETLRIYPLVEPLQRKAQNDYKIPGTDVIVKKGQMVLISAMGIQHDKKYYPNPEKYDPERFSAENVSARHSCAYIPFGTGPRNCIGLRFAKLQSLTCLLKLISKFRVELSKKSLPTMRFTPRRFIIAPEGGIYLNFVPRRK